MSLNRSSAQRKDDHWLANHLSTTNTLLIPIWRDKYLFDNNELVTFLTNDQHASKLIECSSERLFLGIDDQQAVYVLNFSSLSFEGVCQLFKHGTEFFDLRSMIGHLTPKQASILAYGKSLSYWHDGHQHCGSCGHKSASHEGGHMRKCLNEACAREHFPRTDPVVIMLVEHQGEKGLAKCLLAQHHRLPQKVVSTLAGFVDPGESLEEAVAREVFEEAGVVVDAVEYMVSQPWPFPGSLMIGFLATTSNPTLNIDYDELSGAQWFSAEQMSTFSNWGDADDNFQLPRKESIARFLIDTWLVKQSEKDVTLSRNACTE